MPLPAPAKKSLGQNFLVDRRIVSRILAAADLTPNDTVLEIGPGRGILTRPLAGRAGSLTAIELDSDLAAALTTEFAGQPHVRIVHADAREIDIASIVPTAAPYKLIANLPYYAAQPIIRRFLEAGRKPALMVVMVQREVARNMTATPGDMSLLSVATQLYGRPRISHQCASPRIPSCSEGHVRQSSESTYYPNLPSPWIPSRRSSPSSRAGFSAPRKQVHNCLQQGLSIPRLDAETILSQAGIDPRRRPQTLSLDDWGSLYAAWRLRYPETDAS